MDKLPRLLGKKLRFTGSIIPLAEIKFNDSKPDFVCCGDERTLYNTQSEAFRSGEPSNPRLSMSLERKTRSDFTSYIIDRICLSLASVFINQMFSKNF